MQVPVVRAPMSIIALFVSVIELFVAYPVTQLSGLEQLILVLFMTSFPFFVAALFFYVLWHKPLNLYNPSEVPAELLTEFRAQAARNAVLEITAEEHEGIPARAPGLGQLGVDPLVGGKAQATAPTSEVGPIEREAREIQARVEAALPAGTPPRDVMKTARALAREERARRDGEAVERTRQRMGEFRSWLTLQGFNSLPALPRVVLEPGPSTAWFNPTADGGEAHFTRDVADDPTVIGRVYFNACLFEVAGTRSKSGRVQHEQYDQGIRAVSSGTNESNAVYSGLADYFPCSYVGSPHFGAGLGRLFGLSTDWLRNLEDEVILTRNAEYHALSLVWSGACWELRQRLGQAAFDPVLRAVTERLTKGKRVTTTSAAELLASELVGSLGQEVADTAAAAFSKRGVRLAPSPAAPRP